MVTHSNLKYARVGRCSLCNTRYVTFAEIIKTEIHKRDLETYACPNTQCKGDNPKNERVAKGRTLTFALNQLDSRLRNKHLHRLNILSTESFSINSSN